MCVCVLYIYNIYMLYIYYIYIKLGHLPYSRNWHNTVNQLYFNKKQTTPPNKQKIHWQMNGLRGDLPVSPDSLKRPEVRKVSHLPSSSCLVSVDLRLGLVLSFLPLFLIPYCCSHLGLEIQAFSVHKMPWGHPGFGAWPPSLDGLSYWWCVCFGHPTKQVL